MSSGKRPKGRPGRRRMDRPQSDLAEIPQGTSTKDRDRWKGVVEGSRGCITGNKKNNIKIDTGFVSTYNIILYNY